jgi:transposase-like protein
VKLLRRFLIRLSNFVTRRSTDHRLQEEIAEHLAFQTEENLRAGMSPTEARRMEAPKILQEAIQYFTDFENCRQFMAAIRWPDGKVLCPKCQSEKVTYLQKARLYKCYGDHPKPKFSLKVGTVFEDSPIALEKWLPAGWMLVNDKNGISSWKLSRALGVTQKTAWFMLHRIRLALRHGFGAPAPCWHRTVRWKTGANCWETPPP